MPTQPILVADSAPLVADSARDLCYAMLGYVLSCHVMLCYVRSCYVNYVVSCHVMLCCGLLYSKEVLKSNFQQYGQMDSTGGKSQKKIKKEKVSEERRSRCAKR